MRRWTFRIAKALLASLGTLGIAGFSLAFDLTPGYFYGSHPFGNEIVRYDPNGVLVDSITVPSQYGSEIRGLAFGPDQLLYAVASREQDGLAILAINGAGSIVKEYPFTYGNGFILSNLSLGKIAFGAGGEIYVGTRDGLAKFALGDPNSGSMIWQQPNSPVFDVESLPSGNLLIGPDHDLYEITAGGSLVRSIDPGTLHFINVRGLEYDPVDDAIFVTMLGDSQNDRPLMKLDFATGSLQAILPLVNGDDMVLDDGGRLVVGSRVQAPRFFDRNLQLLGGFKGDNRLFVTQMPVPEPGVFASLALASLVLASRKLTA